MFASRDQRRDVQRDRKGARLTTPLSCLSEEKNLKLGAMTVGAAVAVTAAVNGSIVNTLPAGCVPFA